MTDTFEFGGIEFTYYPNKVLDDVWEEREDGTVFCRVNGVTAIMGPEFVKGLRKPPCCNKKRPRINGA